MADTVACGGEGRLDPQRCLAATTLLDVDHPVIRAVARGVAAHAAGERERAIALHDFVRDHVPFGFIASPHDSPASEVLSRRLGCAIAKGTLFAALLRAAGIPARMRFLEIDAGLFRGLLVPGAQYLPHGLVEVWLDGRWMALDSHVVDRPLLVSARRLLVREAALLGYGVHRRGTGKWDGRREAFSQRVVDPAYRITGRDFGVFDDARQFQEGANRMLGPRAIAADIARSVTSLGANGRIERVRGAGR